MVSDIRHQTCGLVRSDKKGFNLTSSGDALLHVVIPSRSA